MRSESLTGTFQEADRMLTIVSDAPSTQKAQMLAVDFLIGLIVYNMRTYCTDLALIKHQGA